MKGGSDFDPIEPPQCGAGGSHWMESPSQRKTWPGPHSRGGSKLAGLIPVHCPPPRGPRGGHRTNRRTHGPASPPPLRRGHLVWHPDLDPPPGGGYLGKRHLTRERARERGAGLRKCSSHRGGELGEVVGVPAGATEGWGGGAPATDGTAEENNALIASTSAGPRMSSGELLRMEEEPRAGGDSPAPRRSTGAERPGAETAGEEDMRCAVSAAAAAAPHAERGRADAKGWAPGAGGDSGCEDDARAAPGRVRDDEATGAPLCDDRCGGGEEARAGASPRVRPALPPAEPKRSAGDRLMGGAERGAAVLSCASGRPAGAGKGRACRLPSLHWRRRRRRPPCRAPRRTGS